MPSFDDLDVWKRSHRLTLQVYQLTKHFPRDERFGLIQQLRRSAASVPTNIAEGSGRLSPSDYRRFVGMAMGSASEVEYQLTLSRDLGYLAELEASRLLADVLDIKRMLRRLEQHLHSRAGIRRP